MDAKFIKCEDGSVTMDWVVMSAAVIGLGMATSAVVVPAINSSMVPISVALGYYTDQIRSYANGAAGYLVTAYGPVKYALHNDGTETEDGAALNYRNKLILNFEQTMTDGLRVDTKALEYDAGGPQTTNIRINGELADLQGMLERGEIVTNIPHGAFRSGTYRGSQYAYLDQRYVSDDSYFEIRVPVDSIEMDAVVHNGNVIVMDVSAL